MLRVPCDGLASYPGESRNTPRRFMLMKSKIRSGLMSHLARMQTLSSVTVICFYMNIFWVVVLKFCCITLASLDRPISIQKTPLLTLNASGKKLKLWKIKLPRTESDRNRNYTRNWPHWSKRESRRRYLYSLSDREVSISTLFKFQGLSQ